MHTWVWWTARFFGGSVTMFMVGFITLLTVYPARNWIGWLRMGWHLVISLQASNFQLFYKEFCFTITPLLHCYVFRLTRGIAVRNLEYNSIVFHQKWNFLSNLMPSSALHVNATLGYRILSNPILNSVLSFSVAKHLRKCASGVFGPTGILD